MPALFLTAKLQFLSEKWDCGTDRYFETMFLIKPSPAASARDALRNLLPLGCLPLTSYPIGAAHSLHLFFSVCDWLAPGGRGSWGAGLTEGGAPPFLYLFVYSYRCGHMDSGWSSHSPASHELLLVFLRLELF